MKTPIQHCGYIGIIGRPNVGKSTLLNQILQKKISITSEKPQTTRHQILGIFTQETDQMIFVDTPGFHRQARRTLNRSMNRAVMQILRGVDIVLLLIDATRWTAEDDLIISKLKGASVKTIVVLNKIDKLNDEKLLLPLMAKLNDLLETIAIVPISAKKGRFLPKLLQILQQALPIGEHVFPADIITDRDERFLLAEIIREKLFRAAGQELPYSATVVIEHFNLNDNIYHVAGLIYIEREGQKKILIGKKGEKLKEVGTRARIDMEKLLGKKVFLQLWIKVREDWPDNERYLQEFGYLDD